MDDAYPSLCLLTLALPWVQVARDLCLLAERSGTPTDIAALADVANRMLLERGHAPATARWISERITHAATELCCLGRGAPLNPVIIDAIAAEASVSLPRLSFWTHAERSARELGVHANG
jgi:hypothetical protein